MSGLRASSKAGISRPLPCGRVSGAVFRGRIASNESFIKPCNGKRKLIRHQQCGVETSFVMLTMGKQQRLCALWGRNLIRVRLIVSGWLLANHTKYLIQFIKYLVKLFNLFCQSFSIRFDKTGSGNSRGRFPL